MSRAFAAVLFLFLCVGCASAPKFKAEKIRAWETSLSKEYPNEKSVIVIYEKGPFELYYLAARKSTAVGSDAFNLVEKLFKEHSFTALLIEPLPYSSGGSPKWFLQNAKKGQTETVIAGGESALAVILADEKKIPFFGGEPDQQDIYKFLKEKNHQDLDILGFYVVRQIPQWVRLTSDRTNLLQTKIPGFLAHYCNLFKIREGCPSMNDVMEWYKTNRQGQELTIDVSAEEVSPLSDGKYPKLAPRTSPRRSSAGPHRRCTPRGPRQRSRR